MSINRYAAATKYLTVAWTSIPLYDFHHQLIVGANRLRFLLGEPNLSYPPIIVCSRDSCIFSEILDLKFSSFLGFDSFDFEV